MMMMMTRRHGWQRPLHPLQIVGMAIYGALVVAFYWFLGLFLGNRIAEIVVTTIFSIVAFSGMFLFMRCAAIDPSDKTRFRKKRRRRSKSNGFLKLNYGFVLGQIVRRFFRRLEREILRAFIRRKYLDSGLTSGQVESTWLPLPFPLVMKDDDAIAPYPYPKEDDVSFCSLCDFEVKKHSKHCRTCNRCVEGFDHHCRWLNNCVGKKNYTTFILLMIFVLLMLIIEGGTAIAIFIRCFVDKRGIERELERKLSTRFPRGVLATISVVLVLIAAYSSVALGQLFLFHVVLIRKGMRTYDYILAMREENQSMEQESFEDLDFSSDESIDFDSPEKPTFVSRLICKEQSKDQNQPRLSIRIDREPKPPTTSKKQGFHAAIDPWKLIKMSREKALLAVEKARERFIKHEPVVGHSSVKPLPLETKSGPLSIPNRSLAIVGSGLTPLISKGARLPVSPGWFSSPRRRFSSSPTMLPGSARAPKTKYKSNFDLKLTEVSRELETYISRQIVCSALKKGSEASPR
ncbi:protein S-acyltransferase 18 [Diospyros lotus]|uniref:protein S-acyltransferase 18 n=1 Tax=Diospyros lotus TaxID=55363 RepID=UPI002254A811|nr:protein S-acyltransferase 18 [Diospyros lotus]